MGPLLHHKGSQWDFSRSDRVNVRVCAIVVSAILLLQHMAESCKLIIDLGEAQGVLAWALLLSKRGVNCMQLTSSASLSPSSPPTLAPLSSSSEGKKRSPPVFFGWENSLRLSRGIDWLYLPYKMPSRCQAFLQRQWWARRLFSCWPWWPRLWIHWNWLHRLHRTY